MTTKDGIFLFLGVTGSAALAYCLRLIMAKAEESSGTAPAETAPPRLRPTANKMGDKPAQIPSTPPPTFEAQKLTFEALSSLWVENEMRKIPFAELARNWRNVDELQPDSVRQDAIFRNADTRLFYETHVKERPFFIGTVYDAAVEVLHILDEFGDCPSVVKGHKDEPEGKIAANTYEILRQVTLRSHSFHVTEEAITNAPAGPIVPKVAVVALAHDLGKMPQYYERYYQTGTHAFASVAVIETLPAVRSLPYFKEVKEAIRLHHVNSDAYLDTILRESDHSARRKEMAPSIESATRAEKAPEPWQPVASEQSPAQTSQPAPEAKEHQEPLKQGEIDCFGNTAQSGDIMGSQTGKTTVGKFRKIDLSEWFDADRFLKELAAIINTTISYEGMQVKEKDQFWSALSLGGHVYFKKNSFWYMIVRHANGNAEVQASATSRQKIDEIMFSVVRELTARPNTIAEEFVGEGYYGASFVIDKNTSKQFYLVPFRAEAFDNVLAGAADERKTPVMKAVKEITPSRKLKEAAK